MRHRSLRRMVLDLTPMIDIIMILLFGVMINSVERVEQESESLKKDLSVVHDDLSSQQTLAQRLASENAALQERLAAAQADLTRSESELAELAKSIEREKLDLAQAMAKLLQMDDEAGQAFRARIERISPGTARELETAMAEMKSAKSPADIYKAIHRIEEMQKVFTFIDLHIDGANFLKLIVNRKALQDFPVAGASAEAIELKLRDQVGDLPLNQIVLVLFSYEANAFSSSVDRTEEAIRALIRYYHSGVVARQFRYAKIGLVPGPPRTNGR